MKKGRLKISDGLSEYWKCREKNAVRQPSFPRRRESRPIRTGTYRVKSFLQFRILDSRLRGNDGTDLCYFDTERPSENFSDDLWPEKGMPLCRVYPTARALNQPNQTSSSTKQKYSTLHIGSGTPSR